MKRLSFVLGALPFIACSQHSEPSPRGLALAVAPLELEGIDVACYDVLVSGAGSDVWSMGDPAVHANAGDGAICSDVYGNGADGDITYIGTCDASEDADTNDDEPGVQNAVTVWFDGLYTGSSADGLDPLDAPIQGTCMVHDLFVGCLYPDPHPAVPMFCGSDADCVLAGTPTWEDPCGDDGCTLEFDCVENQDTLVQFDFTVMRDAKQGFFDVMVEFEDVFCSAKYDTCYDVNEEDERPITLLFGPDGQRDHTGVMGLACTGDPNSDAQTVLHRSEIWVWCDGWQHSFVLDPTAGPGNVEITEQHLEVGGQEQQACELECRSKYASIDVWSKVLTDPDNDPTWASPDDYCATLGDCSTRPSWWVINWSEEACKRELETCTVWAQYQVCLDKCDPELTTLRYATYWGTEALDCGSGPGSCNKVYWNVAIDLEHLFDQGLRDCYSVSIATASTDASAAIVDGELARPHSWYPVIDYGDMDGDWVTGLPLVGDSGIPCVAEPLGGTLVTTDYAATGEFGMPTELGENGPIRTDYWTWLCFAMAQGDDAPAADPECIARYCSEAIESYTFCGDTVTP